MSTLPILCLDFDGVIHHYSRGWRDGTIYDVVTPGFFRWAQKARQYFRLVIYSSRSATPEGVEAMRTWLVAQARLDDMLPTWIEKPEHVLDWFVFADTKPPAFATIDDRAIRFNGDWTDTFLDAERIRRMKTWTERRLPEPPEPHP